MEPQFQTSFIPKKAIDQKLKMVGAKEPVNIFSVIVWLLLIATIAVSSGLFIYQRVLQNQISQAETNIIAAKEAFQLDTIEQMINASNQISTAEKLLNSHILINKMFNLLQSLTVKKIYFVDFFYSAGVQPSILMNGESQSYNALAEQSDIFKQNSSIQNPQFSNFILNQDGNISFKFSGNIDPIVISYQKTVEAVNNQ